MKANRANRDAPQGGSQDDLVPLPAGSGDRLLDRGRVTRRAGQKTIEGPRYLAYDHNVCIHMYDRLGELPPVHVPPDPKETHPFCLHPSLSCERGVRRLLAALAPCKQTAWHSLDIYLWDRNEQQAADSPGCHQQRPRRLSKPDRRRRQPDRVSDGRRHRRVGRHPPLRPQGRQALEPAQSRFHRQQRHPGAESRRTLSGLQRRDGPGRPRPLSLRSCSLAKLARRHRGSTPTRTNGRCASARHFSRLLLAPRRVPACTSMTGRRGNCAAAEPGAEMEHLECDLSARTAGRSWPWQADRRTMPRTRRRQGAPL